MCVPGLVAAFRKEMEAPEHSAFTHWGATSQDIIDTALMLRMRQALTLAETDIKNHPNFAFKSSGEICRSANACAHL